QACGVEEVRTPNHLGDPLLGIIHDNGQMVTGRRLLPCQNGIAPHCRECSDDSGFRGRAFAKLRPGQLTRAGDLLIDVQPERERRSGLDEPSALTWRRLAGVTRIEGRTVGIARPGSRSLPLPDQLGDLGATLETRIDQAET